MAKENMKNETWGELRTLNSDNLTREMVKLGKGNRIKFKLSIGNERSFVIITDEEHNQIMQDRDKIKNLEMKLKTIMNVAGL